ncbi:MAG: 50S ribosome-binding GTPase, partial [Planctomycetaceae bacterium]|nr:50S ribosome-binding GTPase [Planctomycetaceae bacterium]
MTSPFHQLSQSLNQLLPPLRQLADDADVLEVPSLAGREWYELLTRKLIPQLGDDSYLIVAVVGGTNIGKSVIFNHLAGFRASATSPLASGTKHATVLLPPGFAATHDLAEVFPGFTIMPWDNAEQSLVDDERHLLFWREREIGDANASDIPDNLLILDTPDVDSVAQVNWERADHIRQAADVLVAVLTQQKYNDAAVKEFFRKAAAEQKKVLIVFNQCLLPEDEEYWPIWVQTFCDETKVEPTALFVAPADRRAAEANQLPFYERPWPPDDTASDIDPAQPRDLMRELSELRFGEIKLQTLSGSLRQLVHPDAGIPSWLRQVQQHANQFGDAAEILATSRLATIN